MLTAILENPKFSDPKDPFRIISNSGDYSLWGIDKFTVTRRKWSDKTHSFMDIVAEVSMPEEDSSCPNTIKIRKEVRDTIKTLESIGVEVVVRELNNKEFINKYV